jgi:hypothetical protein
MDPVSYNQRTTTLKGVAKVNDMIDEGQGAISRKKQILHRLVKRNVVSQVENCEKSKSNAKNRFILIKNEIVEISNIT